jgi:hypothetical protein
VICLYATLITFLTHFAHVATTPTILTEVSNLLGQVPETIRPLLYQIFATAMRTFREGYVASADIVDVPGFHTFGLTDTNILHEENSKYLVLTDDFRLSQYLQTNGRDVVNFNHIRTANWT